MFKKTIILASLAAMLLVATDLTAQNRDIQFVSNTAFASMRDRLDELETRLAGYESRGSSSVLGSGDCCDGCAGIVAGAGVAFLKAGHSDLKMGNYNYQAAPRVWLGYQRCDGLGARARWFHYDDSNPTPNVIQGALIPGAITQLRYSTVDFEITDTFKLGCKWQGTLAGGVRYAKYHETYKNDPDNFLGIDDAIGPVLGIEMSRTVTDRISLIGLLRQSILMGHENDDNSLFLDDLGYATTELQVGSEYRRSIGRGCAELFVRSAFEAQYLAGVSNDDAEAVTLMGGNFSFGISR